MSQVSRFRSEGSLVSLSEGACVVARDWLNGDGYTIEVYDEGGSPQCMISVDSEQWEAMVSAVSTLRLPRNKLPKPRAVIPSASS